jgi:hypothetical protein
MWRAIKTFVLVFGITLLVWAYAAAKLIEAEPGIEVIVELETDSPERLVSVEGEDHFMIDVRGRRQALLRAKGQIRKSESVLKVRVPADRRPRNHTESAADFLAENAPALNGLRITTTQPEKIQYVVDRLVVETLPVKAIAPAGIEFASEPVIQPDKVDVSIAESALKRLKERGESPILFARVPAPPTGADLQQSESHTASLEASVNEESMNLSVETVKVTCGFVRVEGSKEFDRVSIGILLLPGLSSQTREIDADISDLSRRWVKLTVSGPESAVASLSEDDVVAWVKVDESDYGKLGVPIRKEVRISAPLDHPPLTWDVDVREVKIVLTEKGQEKKP